MLVVRRAGRGVWKIGERVLRHRLRVHHHRHLQMMLMVVAMTVATATPSSALERADGTFGSAQLLYRPCGAKDVFAA